MRTVRSVINEALFIISFYQDGQDVPDGYQFARNFYRFQNVAASIRTEYPFNIRRILTFAELSDVPFVSLDSVVGSTSFSSSNVRFPMQVVPHNVYEQLTINPISGGIPQYYYFEPPSLVLTFPTELSDYEFELSGKLNESLTLEPDDEFTDSSYVFINYLTWRLAEYYSAVYQKEWTSKHQMCLARAYEGIKSSKKKNYEIYSPDDASISRIYRVRNFIK